MDDKQMTLEQQIKAVIRDVPDFPKPGILFKDITPLVATPSVFAVVIDALAERYRGRIDSIVGVESRGFLFGAPLAYRLQCPFHAARKAGKLPAQVIAQSYALEYGTATIELHLDAVRKGDRVLVIDDLLATGGTAKATCQLIERLEGNIVECAFLIELAFLNGHTALAPYPVYAMAKYT